MALLALPLLGACGSPPHPAPSPPRFSVDPCSLITPAQVSGASGTTVGAGTRDGFTCTFPAVSTTAIGLVDPSMSPPPNVAIGAVIIRDGPTLAAVAEPQHITFEGRSPVPIPGANTAFFVFGPHIELLFLDREGLAIEIEVTRGRSADSYLERRVATVLLAGLSR